MTLDEVIARLEAGESGRQCVLWPGKLDKTGRGHVWVDGRIKLAHRAVWERVRGPIPTGKLLCHHCDVPACVNPDHLYVGTHADNMRDMKERRRYFAAKEPERAREIGRLHGKKTDWSAGENNPKCRLTTEQAEAIFSDGRPTKVLAGIYGVNRTTIQRIRAGSTWNLKARQP